jgi:hypothetical protein
LSIHSRYPRGRDGGHAMSDTDARLRSRIFAALKLAAAANRLDVADHLLRALEILEASGTGKRNRVEKLPLH